MLACLPIGKPTGDRALDSSAKRLPDYNDLKSINNDPGIPGVSLMILLR